MNGDNKYPTKVCSTCVKSIREWTLFKVRSQKAHHHFCKLLNVPPHSARRVTAPVKKSSNVSVLLQEPRNGALAKESEVTETDKHVNVESKESSASTVPDAGSRKEVNASKGNRPCPGTLLDRWLQPQVDNGGPPRQETAPVTTYIDDTSARDLNVVPEQEVSDISVKTPIPDNSGPSEVHENLSEARIAVITNKFPELKRLEVRLTRLLLETNKTYKIRSKLRASRPGPKTKLMASVSPVRPQAVVKSLTMATEPESCGDRTNEASETSQAGGLEASATGEK